MYEHLCLEEEQQQVASSQWNWHWHRNNCWRLESTNHERAVNAIQSVRSSDRSIWGLECCMRAELGIIRHNMLNMLTEAMRMGRSTGHSWQLCKLPVRHWQTNLKYASPNLPPPLLFHLRFFARNDWQTPQAEARVFGYWIRRIAKTISSLFAVFGQLDD